MVHFKQFPSVAAAILVTVMAIPVALAASDWIGLTSDWGVADNWDPAGVPDAAGAAATFGNVIGMGTRLVSSGATWRYLDVTTGADPGVAYVSPDGGPNFFGSTSFDASAWPSGTTWLGYGQTDWSTPLNNIPEQPSGMRYAVYFRTTFDAGDPSVYSSLWANIARDDGAVVYLNGRELFRSNMPTTGDIAWTTMATPDTMSGANEYAAFSYYNLQNLLTPTNNILAVEVHQAGDTSSDLSFNMELLGVASVLATVDLGATDRTVGAIEFANGFATTIQSGGGALVLDNNGIASTITVDGAHTISAPVVLHSDVTVSGSGTLRFGDISGPGRALSSTGVTVELAGGKVDLGIISASLNYYGGNLSAPFIQGTSGAVYNFYAGYAMQSGDNIGGPGKFGSLNLGASDQTGDVSFTVPGGATIDLSADASGSLAVRGGGGHFAELHIAGGAVIVKTALAGDLTGTKGGITQDGGSFQVAGTLTLSGTNAGDLTEAYYHLNSGSLTVGDILNVGRANTCAFIQTGGAVSVANQTRIGRFSGAVGVFDQSGGDNTFNQLWVGYEGTGIYTITRGTMAANTIGIAQLNAVSQGTLNLDGGRLTLTGPAPAINVGVLGTGVLNLNGGTLDAANGNITLCAGRSVFNVTAGTLENVAQIHDDAAPAVPQPLVKTGIGTLALDGVNHYSGGTAVSEGKLLVISALGLPAGGGLTIGSGGAVAMQSGVRVTAAAEGGLDLDHPSAAVNAVPEPGALALLAAAAGTVACVFRWKRSRS
jgi:autotransporter-associated beta strand protein